MNPSTAQGICTTTEGILGASGAVGAPVVDLLLERLLVSSLRLLLIIKLSRNSWRRTVGLFEQNETHDFLGKIYISPRKFACGPKVGVAKYSHFWPVISFSEIIPIGLEAH